VLEEVFRLCAGLFGVFISGTGADLIARGGNAGIGFSEAACAVEAPLTATAGPEKGPGAEGERAGPMSTYIGRVADAEPGGLGTCMITVVGVFVVLLISLTPSWESMSVSLSKAGPFLNPGVVRSKQKLSIHQIPNMRKVNALPMKDVTSYWVPAELTFIRDMFPDMVISSPLLRPGESSNDCGVVG